MASRNPGPLLISISQGEVDAIPAPFRSACTFTVATQPVPLETTLTSTSSSVVESKLLQTRTDEKNNSVTSVTFPSNPLLGSVITPQGQLGSVSYVIGPTSSLSLVEGPLVVDGSITPITDLISVSTITTVGTLFDQSAQTNTQAFTIPDKYLAPGAYRETISTVIAATVATPDALGTGGDGITEATAERVTSQHVRKTIKTQYGGTTEPVTDYERGPQGQSVTATESISNDGTAFTIDSTVLSATVTTLGGGFYNRVIKNATLFSEQEYFAEIALPFELRHRIPTNETSSIVAGTAAQPTLAAGQLENREQQVTVQTKRVTIKTYSVASLPIVYTGTEFSKEYGGVMLDVTTTLSTTRQSKTETDLEFVSFTSEEIAPNLFLTIEKSNPGETWPVLTEYELDPLLQSLITITSQVVAASTTLPAAPVGTLQRLVPVDQFKSLLVTTVYATPSSYYEFRTIGYRYPGHRVQLISNPGCGYASENYPAREMLVQATVLVQFAGSHNGVVLIPPTQFKPTYLSINGAVPIEGLTDGGDVIEICSGASITTSPSVPSNTTYGALVAAGATFVASNRSELWKAKIYKIETVMIPYL